MGGRAGHHVFGLRVGLFVVSRYLGVPRKLNSYRRISGIHCVE